jgi:hypothetical protein
MQEEMSSYLGLTRNIIEIISNNILSDKFVIMLHDTNRSPEKSLTEMCKLVLKKKSILFNEYQITYGKGTTVLTNVTDYHVCQIKES